MRKDLPRALLTFTRHERRGVFALLSVLAVAWLLPFLSERKPMRVEGVDWQRLPSADSLAAPSSPNTGVHRYEKSDFQKRRSTGQRFRPPAEVFPFDPNTSTEAEWLRMGLTQRQAKTILNYVSKGGRFWHAEDLKRIYGFPSEAVEILAPHVRIPSFSQASGRGPFSRASRHSNGLSQPRRPPASVGINTADSAAWEALPGIGPFLASRIVRFRDRLGGFHSVSQVGETFGLQDSVFQRILPLLMEEPGSFSAGLDVNTANLEELKSHPYITHRLARSIIAYREQHGGFSSPEDLQAIETLTPELFERLKPYLMIR